MFYLFEMCKIRQSNHRRQTDSDLGQRKMEGLPVSIDFLFRQKMA
jgi:hypothetical protein